VPRAWRIIYDPEYTGPCCQATFMKASQLVGFRGDLKSTWAELSGGGRTAVTLGDLDPEASQLLTRFTNALSNHYGSLKEGLHIILHSSRKTGTLHFEDFKDICIKLGFRPKEAKMLWSCLDHDINKRTPLDDYRFLSHWQPEWEKIVLRDFTFFPCGGLPSLLF